MNLFLVEFSDCAVFFLARPPWICTLFLNINVEFTSFIKITVQFHICMCVLLQMFPELLEERLFQTLTIWLVYLCKLPIANL